MYISRSSTDVSTGSPAFTINASDPEHQPLTYTLTGPNSGFFTVNRNTGVVSVQRQLDREVYGGGFNYANNNISNLILKCIHLCFHLLQSSDLMQLGVIVSDGPNDVSDNPDYPFYLY